MYTGTMNRCVWCGERCSRRGTWRTAKGEKREGYIHRECEPQNRDKDKEDWS